MIAPSVNRTSLISVHRGFRRNLAFRPAAVLCALLTSLGSAVADQLAVALPEGVKAVWDENKAYHETTTTRERVCLNGLWMSAGRGQE